MFKWLKKKAGEQSLYNVKINTKTLILVSNRAHEKIQATGMSEDKNTKDVVSAQKSLLSDMNLAIANGMSIQQVREAVDEAKSEYTVSKGAEMSIANVLNHLE